MVAQHLMVAVLFQAKILLKLIDLRLMQQDI
jgi:hypothetical protein